MAATYSSPSLQPLVLTPQSLNEQAERNRHQRRQAPSNRSAAKLLRLVLHEDLPSTHRTRGAGRTPVVELGLQRPPNRCGVVVLVTGLAIHQIGSSSRLRRCPYVKDVSPNAGSVSEVSVGSFRQSRLATDVGPVLRAHIVVDLDRQPFAVQAVRSVASRT